MSTMTLETPDAVQALTHPVRIRILELLRTPDSAAAVARVIGETRQKVNYHLKELERAGLVTPAGERRKGNFVEQLFQSVARSFVVSARLGWGAERQAALQSQTSLAQLVVLGEGLQRDAIALLDRAAFDGADIASASVQAEVRFPDAAARSAFMTDYLAALGPLLKKHGSRRGAPFRVVVAAYPDPEED